MTAIVFYVFAALTVASALTSVANLCPGSPVRDRKSVV